MTGGNSRGDIEGCGQSYSRNLEGPVALRNIAKYHPGYTTATVRTFELTLISRQAMFCLSVYKDPGAHDVRKSRL